MTGGFTLRCVGAALALAVPATAHAAPVLPDKNAKAGAQILTSASVRKLQDIDFGFVAVTSAGTAVVNPNTDAMTTTGGVIQVGGLPYAALFEAVAPVKSNVLIKLPNKPITVTRVGGTETMTVSNWTINGSTSRNVNAKEPFAFKVGATLFVSAGQVEGTYTGTFTVDVNYN
jgi:hypothetical protein